MHLVCSKLSPPKPRGGPCDSGWTTATGHCVSFHLNWSSWPGGIFPRLSSSRRHLDCSNLSGENWLWFFCVQVNLARRMASVCLFAPGIPFESCLIFCRPFLAAVEYWQQWMMTTELFFFDPASYLDLTLISSESIIWLVECGVF